MIDRNQFAEYLKSQFSTYKEFRACRSGLPENDPVHQAFCYIACSGMDPKTIAREKGLSVNQFLSQISFSQLNDNLYFLYSNYHQFSSE